MVVNKVTELSCMKFHFITFTSEFNEAIYNQIENTHSSFTLEAFPFALKYFSHPCRCY